MILTCICIKANVIFVLKRNDIIYIDIIHFSNRLCNVELSNGINISTTRLIFIIFINKFVSSLKVIYIYNSRAKTVLILRVRQSEDGSYPATHLQL